MKILSIRIKIWHRLLMNILLILKAHLWPMQVLLRLWGKLAQVSRLF